MLSRGVDVGFPSEIVISLVVFIRFLVLNVYFIALIHPIQWTIAFTGRRDRSRQTPEKDVLYIIPAGPVSSVHSLGGASYLLPVCQSDVSPSFSFHA